MIRAAAAREFNPCDWRPRNRAESTRRVMMAARMTAASAPTNKA